METLLLTVHSTGSGEIPLPKALALVHTMNLPDSKESCSALLQDSKTGRHSRRGSLQHKIPVGFFLQLQEHKHLFVHHHPPLCLSKMHQYFTKNCPQTRPGGAPTHLWACGTWAPVGSGLEPQQWGCLKTGCNNQPEQAHPSGMWSTGKPPAVVTDKRLHFSPPPPLFLNRKWFYNTRPKCSASRHGATYSYVLVRFCGLQAEIPKQLFIW